MFADCLWMLKQCFSNAYGCLQMLTEYLSNA